MERKETGRDKKTRDYIGMVFYYVISTGYVGILNLIVYVSIYERVSAGTDCSLHRITSELYIHCISYTYGCDGLQYPLKLGRLSE